MGRMGSMKHTLNRGIYMCTYVNKKLVSRNTDYIMNTITMQIIALYIVLHSLCYFVWALIHVHMYNVPRSYCNKVVKIPHT